MAYPVAQEGFGTNRDWPAGLCPHCGPIIAECIKKKAAEAADEKYNDCQDSVILTGEGIGIEWPEGIGTNLDANSFIDYLEGNWEKIDYKQAKQEAANGEYVIAGRKGPIIKSEKKQESGEEERRESGHVVTIVTGKGRQGYPNCAGGTSKCKKKSDAVERMGYPFCKGNNTVRDAFGISKEILESIGYYKPKNKALFPASCCQVAIRTPRK
jgi:hypothetical protein